MDTISFPWSDVINKILMIKPLDFSYINSMKIISILAALEIVLKNKIPGDIIGFGNETKELVFYIKLLLDHYDEFLHRKLIIYQKDVLCSNKYELITLIKNSENKILDHQVIHKDYSFDFIDIKQVAFAYYDGIFSKTIINFFDDIYNNISKGGYILLDYNSLSPVIIKMITESLSNKKFAILENFSNICEGILIVKDDDVPKFKSIDYKSKDKYKILYGSGDSYADVGCLLKENFKYPHLHFGDHLIGKDKDLIIEFTNGDNFKLHISNNGMLMVKNVKNIKNLDKELLMIFYGAANYYNDVTNLLLEKDLDTYKYPHHIFGDHLVGHHKTVKIIISDIIIEINDKGEIRNTTERLKKSLTNNDRKIIAFHQEHLSERGTSITIYDYANYNEKLLGNESIIIYKKNHYLTHPKMKQHFESRFKCIEYENFDEINNIIINYEVFAFYNIVGENVKLPIYNCRNLTHSVFSGIMLHGDVHCSISEVVSDFMKVVPHMISLNIEEHNPSKDNMRKELGIPTDAIVIGRHGGKNSFDINYVKDAVIQLINENEDIWFIFLNTQCFVKHPRVIYLEATVEEYLKCKFILTCDAMLHASILGETFGLAIGEFSVCNKPIITTDTGKLMHLKILGDKALIYRDINSLKQLVNNIKIISKTRNDWNAYEQYSPEKVMEIFNNTFLS